MARNSIPYELVEDIVRSDRFLRAKTLGHHGKVSLADHSRRTAMYGRNICRSLEKRGIPVSEKDVVRACLLHDIGMTDLEVFDKVSWKKAYLHPTRGAAIAREEYRAGRIQCDAIRKHMWPICIIPPLYKESWVVLAADKWCSFHEFLERVKKRNLRENG